MNDNAETSQTASEGGTSNADGEAGGLPPILTIDELASFLRVNRKTVYEAISRGEIPGVRRIGHTFRISRDAVTQWLSRSPGGAGSRRRPSL